MRKRDSELRITIIGMGNLMEAIFPCIVETIGQENLTRQVNATTADEADYKGKEARLGIKVTLNDNLKALKELEPDIILFAPPPHVATELIQGDLRKYFEYFRGKSATLPEIYSFPPVPPGAVYKQILGEGVLVVNVLPNMIRTVEGKPLKGEGATTCTFPSPWPQESLDRLRRILSSLGDIIDLKPEEVLPLLGGGCMIHALPEVALSISDMLEKKGEKIGHQRLGSYMRSRLQETTKYSPEESDPCSTATLEGPLQSLMGDIILAWYDGLKKYYIEVEFSQERIAGILDRMMDLLLHVAQGEPREVILKNTEIAATKSGVLERALKYIHENIEPMIEDAIKGLPDTPDEQWRSTLSDRVREGAHVVWEHGITLNRTPPGP